MGRGRGPSNAEKRSAVLAAAEALIAEHGHDVALSEISLRAGVSRQTLYNHYGGKAGLLDALAARCPQPCPPCAGCGAGPPEQALAAYAATLLRWACGRRQVMALRARCRGFRAGDPRETDGQTDALRTLSDYLRLETLRGRLVAPDPETAARLFLDLVLAGPQLRIALGEAAGAEDLEIEATARRCAQLFLRGCAGPRTASSAPRQPPPPLTAAPRATAAPPPP